MTIGARYILDTSELTRLRFLGPLMDLDRPTRQSLVIMSANLSFQSRRSTRGWMSCYFKFWDYGLDEGLRNVSCCESRDGVYS
jgi:hypothetical protein